MQMTEQTVPNAEAFTATIYFPYDICFVDCDTSEAARFQIEEHLARLSHFYDRIIDCKVVVRVLHKHSVNRFFHVHVQLDVPGKRLAVSREPEARDEHMALRASVRDSFQKITRQLEDLVKFRIQRKTHAGRRSMPIPEVF